jgi:microcystin-dependent protein/type II secretory pathway pseudopilin PulG
MAHRHGSFTRKGMSMKNTRAFTLIELSLTLAMALIMAGALVPNYVRSLHIEAAKKTALEMSQIAEAARVYYIQNNAWPDGLDVLKAAGFIDSAWKARNPFAGDYTLELSGADLGVKTVMRQEMVPVVAAALPMSGAAGTAVWMSVTPPGALAQATPTGTIVPWAALDIPEGWFICDGRALSRMEQAALFAVIGTRYGAGDGTSTFDLPDLRGRTIVGMDDMGGGAANVLMDARARVLGGKFGEEKHALTLAEMPAHAHSYTYTPWWGGRYDGHSSPVMTPGEATGTTGPAGGGNAHNIVQPSMALLWIIKG